MTNAEVKAVKPNILVLGVVGLLVAVVLVNPASGMTMSGVPVLYVTDAGSWTSDGVTIDTQSSTWSSSGSAITLKAVGNTLVSSFTDSACPLVVRQDGTSIGSVDCDSLVQRVAINRVVLTQVGGLFVWSWVGGYAEYGLGNSVVNWQLSAARGGTTVWVQSGHAPPPWLQGSTGDWTELNCPVTWTISATISTPDGWSDSTSASEAC